MQPIDCDYIPLSREWPDFDQTFVDLIKLYGFVKLRLAEKESLASACSIELRDIAPKEGRTFVPTIAFFTLFLLPLYESYQDKVAIKIRMKIGQKKIVKDYRYGNATYYWFPFFPALFTQHARKKAALKAITDDFFYNELPRAQAAAAHQN